MKEVANMPNAAVAQIAEPPANAVPEKLMTVAQIGEQFAMTERAVYNAVWRGTLPVLRLGRRLRFRRSDVERILR